MLERNTTWDREARESVRMNYNLGEREISESVRTNYNLGQRGKWEC